MVSNWLGDHPGWPSAAPYFYVWHSTNVNASYHYFTESFLFLQDARSLQLRPFVKYTPVYGVAHVGHDIQINYIWVSIESVPRTLIRNQCQSSPCQMQCTEIIYTRCALIGVYATGFTSESPIHVFLKDAPCSQQPTQLNPQWTVITGQVPTDETSMKLREDMMQYLRKKLSKSLFLRVSWNSNARSSWWKKPSDLTNSFCHCRV